ncbi:MAG TPA: PEP-CTERM sorting domain-containing protein, partial [Planctomycetota bacterium]|nr:PEP-CTERM sorting domain-containing protein [Planctomycetota bacterium]
GGLYVGRYGAGTLNVLNGGSVSNTRGYLGYETTGTGTATVDGAGSTWTNTAALYVGGSATAAGGTGLLTVQNDGLVHAGTLLKVWDAGTVNVTGGQLVAGGPAPGIDGSLTIGRDAAAQLSIVGGGDVLNTNGYLGYSGGGNGTATVTGAGSTWTNSGDLYVGRIGWGTLSVQNGGRVESGGGYLGDAGIGVGTATVDGVGSTWANSSSLLVGFFGWGTLNVQNGGSVSNRGGCLGYIWSGVGTATVTGAGSTWTNSMGGLQVGYFGTGTLNVQNGGSVSSGNGWLAYADGSNGTATVTGAGSTWTNTAALYVGGSADAAGGTGLLTVQNGGEVRVGDTLKVWGAGTVNLNAGGLVVADVAEVVPGSTFNTQAGSTLRVNALSGFGDHPSFAGALQFGHAGGGGSGGYTLGAGQSLQTGEGLTVGYDATGVFTQTGGANTVGGDLVLASEAGSTGTYHYQGGTLSLGGAIRGGAGTSAFIVGGGSGFPMLSYDGSLSLVNLSIFGIENQGTVEVLGGATLSPGQLTVAAGGLLAIDRATVALTTALNNDGEVLLGNAVSARIQAPVVNNSGLLGGQGRVLADVANTGELFVGAAERLTITGGVDNDGGLLTVAGGTMTVQGDLDNYNAAQVALGGTLRLNGSLTNRDGGMVVGNGWLQADAGLANSSTMAFSGVTNVRGDVDNTGLIIVSGVGPTTFFDDLTNNGEIRVSGGTSAVYFGCVDGAGIFTGTGTNYFEGDLCPGTSPGILSFEGDVVFAATNHLIMELAGFDADTGYDQVNILGNLTLGGELELIVDRAFRDLIQPDDTFILMTAGTLSGEFSNVAPGATLQSADLLSEFTVYYGPASPYGAEFVVLGNAAAIPEPATLTLLALGGLGLLRRRRRRWR